jgi:hypothetical protein
MTVASKRSRHRGGGGGEGVPTRRWQRRRRGPSGGSVHSNRFRDGGPVKAVCKRNKNLPCDSGRKAGPEFTVSSISNGSMWNRC